MDFDLSPEQHDRLAVLRSLVAGAVGDAAVTTSTVADAVDAPLESAIAVDARLQDPRASLLDRVLLVEEAARLAAPVNGTGGLLLRPLLAPSPAAGPVAVRIAAADHPMRFAEHAEVVIDVTAPQPAIAVPDRSTFAAVASGMVEGYGTVTCSDTRHASWVEPISPALAFCLGRAAEIAGAARGAHALTASYLGRRQQFGRTLSGFQALRHRMSELAVDIEAVSVLVRRAAHDATPKAVLAAASYAVDRTTHLVRELHQISGARGFTPDLGLPVRTMQMMAARAELVEVGAVALAYADATWSPRS